MLRPPTEISKHKNKQGPGGSFLFDESRQKNTNAHKLTITTVREIPATALLFAVGICCDGGRRR